MKYLKILTTLLLCLFVTLTQAQITAGGCTSETVDPCSGVTCADNQTCVDGECVCTDLNACSTNDVGECVYPNTADCLDCNNETVCVVGTVCDGNGSCIAQECSVDGGVVDITDALEAAGINTDFNNSFQEAYNWVVTNLSQYADGTIISYTFSTSIQSRCVTVDSEILIPAQIKEISINEGGNAYVFNPVLTGEGQNLADLANDILIEDFSQILFDSFVLDGSETCVTFCNATGATNFDVVYCGENNTTSFFNFSVAYGDNTTKTNQFIIENCVPVFLTTVEN